MLGRRTKKPWLERCSAMSLRAVRTPIASGNMITAGALPPPFGWKAHASATPSAVLISSFVPPIDVTPRGASAPAARDEARELTPVRGSLNGEGWRQYVTQL